MATGFSIRYKSRSGSRGPSNWSGHKKSWEFSPGSRGHLACKRLFRPQALECSTRPWQRRGKVEGEKCITIKSFTFIIFSWSNKIFEQNSYRPVPYNLTGQGLCSPFFIVKSYNRWYRNDCFLRIPYISGIDGSALQQIIS